MKYQETGSFDFCSICPKGGVCCTNKGADLPVLLPYEVSLISKSTGLGDNDFTNDCELGEVRQMKGKNGVCFFYQNNHCSIYENRPLDCKLFPFDLKINDRNGYDLVLYDTRAICGLSISVKSYFSNIIELIKKNKSLIKPYIETYTSSRWSECLSKVKYSCIEEDVF
jgi:Fe-S-cluster containining protein